MQRRSNICPLIRISLSLVLVIYFSIVSRSQAVHKEVDHGLIPPLINTSPLPKYDYDQLDYGMNMGIEKTSKGRFWACWTAGGDDPSSFMLAASSDDRGVTWSKPRVVIDAQDSTIGRFRAVQNGNLWTDPLGHLWFFFDQSMTDFDGRAGLWYTKCENPDSDTPLWSPAKRIWHGTAKSKPIVLSSGEWILPVSLLNRGIIDKHPGYYLNAYQELDSFRMANVFVSTDQGKTWTRRGGVQFPDPSFDEHHIVEKNDGILWMTARTNNGIWQSFSDDKGKSWSAPSKFLEHVSSRHFIRRLKTGRLLLVKHGNLNENTKKRSHLMAFLSEDDGRTWLEGGLLLDDRSSISYPDGFQDDDGTIYVTYDYKRQTHGQVFMARFTEKDILEHAFNTYRSLPKIIIYRPLAVGVKEVHQALPFEPELNFLKLPLGKNMGEVSGIAVNSKGNILVFHRGKQPLLEFSNKGEFIRSIGDDLFIRGHGLKVDKQDNIWTTDREAHVVLKINPQGKVLMVLGRWNHPGEESMYFNKPTDVAFDSKGNIYVTDGYGNSRIVKYDNQGNFLKAWGTKGDAAGQFDLPHTIVVDNEDKVYVGDRENNRIQIFDTEGKLLKIWNHIGSPWGLVFQGGRFFMADGFSNRIVELNQDGKPIAQFGVSGKDSGKFGYAHSLAADKLGNLYVAEILNWRVQKLNRKK